MTSEPDDPVMEALWHEALEDLHAKEAHDKLLQHAASEGALAELAKRYRTQRDELPEDDEIRTILDDRLAAITTLAIADLEARKPERPERHPVATLLMVLLGLMFIASVAAFLRALLL